MPPESCGDLCSSRKWLYLKLTQKKYTFSTIFLPFLSTAHRWHNFTWEGLGSKELGPLEPHLPVVRPNDGTWQQIMTKTMEKKSFFVWLVFPHWTSFVVELWRVAWPASEPSQGPAHWSEGDASASLPWRAIRERERERQEKGKRKKKGRARERGKGREKGRERKELGGRERKRERIEKKVVERGKKLKMAIYHFQTSIFF